MGVADELRDLRGIDRPKQRFGLGIVMRLDQTVGERRVDGLRQRFAGGHRGACSADIRDALTEFPRAALRYADVGAPRDRGEGGGAVLGRLGATDGTGSTTGRERGWQ